MMLQNRYWDAAILMLGGVMSCLANAQVNMTTYHNESYRPGVNNKETILTPASVNFTQFGKLFTVAVDGYVYAQPLVLSGVKIAGGTHHVVYVATEHDSVYAIDGDSGAVYWYRNLIPAGGRTFVGNTDIAAGCDDIVPEIGITGTPVIDPATDTLYVVAKSVVGGSYFQYLHALDVRTGAEKFAGPVKIQASVPGTGYDAANGIVTFSARQENQRSALLLNDGRVSIAWSSHCDINPWHGWIMSYDAATLKLEAVMNTTPNGKQGGIWMSGGGLAADASGDILFASGNGTWDGVTAFGDSIVKIAPPKAGSFPVLDYFTPFDQATLDGHDLDLGSGAPILLPTLPSGRELLAQMGKIGTVYVVDRNDMGKFCGDLMPACMASDPQIVEEIQDVTTGVWGSPAYWNGRLYWGAEYDHLLSFSFNTETGAISSSPTSRTPEYFGYAPPVPTVSANGHEAGIVWVLDASANTDTCSSGGVNCQILYAYDATNLANLLYSSSFAPNGRDVPGAAVKFATPTVANGKVYVGSQRAISAYGELGVTPMGVSLSGVGNVFGLANTGAPVLNGGVDQHGDAYPAAVLGTSVTWANSTYTLAAPGPASAVTRAAILLPVGNYASLSVLATGVGAQAGATFLVTYADGTTTSFTQSLSDWGAPQNYTGESIAAAVAYRITKTGKSEAGPYYLYGYTFALNAAKTVKSLTLPQNPNVVVLAVDVRP